MEKYREYIIQHQNMKVPLQQSYRNIALGSEAFIIYKGHILFSRYIILKEDFSIFFSLFKMNRSQLWILT